jgi:hypothetical protein
MNAIIPQKMTNAQMKALNGAIRKEIANSVDDLKANIEAIVLWQIHEQLGYGVKRLETFLEGFQPALQELNDFYNLEDADETKCACVHNLKSIGFDTDKLGKAFPVEYVINA